MEGSEHVLNVAALNPSKIDEISTEIKKSLMAAVVRRSTVPSPPRSWARTGIVCGMSAGREFGDVEYGRRQLPPEDALFIRGAESVHSRREFSGFNAGMSAMNPRTRTMRNDEEVKLRLERLYKDSVCRDVERFRQKTSEEFCISNIVNRAHEDVEVCWFFFLLDGVRICWCVFSFDEISMFFLHTRFHVICIQAVGRNVDCCRMRIQWNITSTRVLEEIGRRSKRSSFDVALRRMNKKCEMGFL